MIPGGPKYYENWHWRPKDTNLVAKRCPMDVKMGLWRTLWPPKILEIKLLGFLLAVNGLKLEPCGIT